MVKYKVLTHDMCPPFQGGEPYEIGKEYACANFDDNVGHDCSNGYYATDLEGLTYALNYQKGNRAFEVEVSGKQVIFNQFKQRFERMKIIREVPIDELKELVKQVGCGYDLYKALFPTNPLTGEPKGVTDEEIDLLNNFIKVRYSVWDSVRDSVRDSVLDSVLNSVRDSVLDSVWDSVWNSVRDSVRDSVRYSVWYSVWDSVWDSVRDSVLDSVYSYIGSIFYNIQKWEGIEHEHDVYPFQSGADLWGRGFVPSFDGTTWRLHSGENAKVVYEKEAE